MPGSRLNVDDVWSVLVVKDVFCVDSEVVVTEVTAGVVGEGLKVTGGSLDTGLALKDWEVVVVGQVSNGA